MIKNLEAADADEAAARALEVERLVDRAAARGALHANTAARRKSRVQRILASKTA